jgi:2-keto-4-pentenoate hydratase/2-oxohepta-3-ene-1,7-dioic acid hydratase in catechol pathway
MHYARYEHGGVISYGKVAGDFLEEISGPPYLAHQPSGRRVSMRDVRLLAPCEPTKIFAMAGNYLDHLRSEHVSPTPPEEPRPFLKVPSSVIGPLHPIDLPPEQEQVEEEAELVVVMGRACRRVSPAEAAGYVFGYTCGNDVSARGWQKTDRSWWRAKSSDTFTPLGPYLVTGLDGGNLEIAARVNGHVVQQCNTRDLIHGIPALVSFLSQSVTLLPGDLIFTGTTGVPARIAAGDTVEVEIQGIGLLSNPVRAELFER